MAKQLVCWNCGESVADVLLPISRHVNCENCFEVLHCCRMCQHYRPTAHIQCDEERADPPVVKEVANFCEYFKAAYGRYDPGSDNTGEAISKLDALFDNAAIDDTQSDKPVDSVQARLNDLFDD